MKAGRQGVNFKNLLKYIGGRRPVRQFFIVGEAMIIKGLEGKTHE